MSPWLTCFQTQDALSERDVARGTRLIVLEGICVMGMITLQGGVFLTAFALALGASNYQVGLIVTIAFLSQVMQIPGLYLLTRFPKRRGIIVVCAGLSRLLWVPIVLLPLLAAGNGMLFLLQCLAISALIGALAGPAWNSLVRDIIPTQVMGRVFSKRLALGTALALALTLAGGYFVDAWKVRFPDVPLYAYSLLFGAGLILGMVSVFLVGKIPEPAMPSGARVGVVGLLLEPARDRNFRALLIFIAVWSLAVNMAGPFFVIYLLKRIQVSLFLVTILAVTSQVTNLVFLRIWGRLADRFSNKSVLSLSGFMFLLSILMWCFTTLPERHTLTLPLLFAIHILSGTATAGIAIASMNIALKLSPKESAHGYMTVFGLVASLAGAVAPLAGGLIADGFAASELSLSMNWSGPTGKMTVRALDFRALDFLFFTAFAVGLYALHRLTQVKEAGEVEQRQVLQELVNEVTVPVRMVSSVGGIRRLAYLSFASVLQMRWPVAKSPEADKADVEHPTPNAEGESTA